MPFQRYWQFYLVLGFLGGLGLTYSCAQSEQLTIYARNILFDRTTHSTAREDVQGVLDELMTSVDTIKGSTPKTSLCPAGYAQSQSGTKIFCKRGKDELVRVGDFWVDRYELTLVDSKSWNNGTCDGTGTMYNQENETLPTTFPGSGNWTSSIYACSVKGFKPSRMVNYFQASQACALSGKRLCTNGEWQTAAAGTPDDQAKCNQGVTNKAHAAGAMATCESLWGAMDMVGNLTEIVDQWGISGLPWMSGNSDSATPWPGSSAGAMSTYGDGMDSTQGVNGTGDMGGVKVDTFDKGMPVVYRRGGDFDDGARAGVFNNQIHIGAVYRSFSTGARCCRR